LSQILTLKTSQACCTPVSASICDLVAGAVAAEHLMAAQIHRFKKAAEEMLARGRGVSLGL